MEGLDNNARTSLDNPEHEGTEGVDEVVDNIDESIDDPTPEGQPDESGTEQTGGELSGLEGLPDGIETPKQLLDMYKNLQKDYAKRGDTEAALIKRFEQYGGADGLLESAEYLSKNPRFQEFVENERTQGLVGDTSVTNDMDEETRSAVKLVEQITNKIVEQKINEAMRTNVDPIADSYKQRLLQENFKSMDSKYGSEWRESQDQMAELAERLPDNVQDNPTLEDLEDLYYGVLRRSGKLESMQAAAYRKQLEETKSKSTGRPSRGTSKGSAKQASTMAEAFEMAKKDLNY